MRKTFLIIPFLFISCALMAQKKRAVLLTSERRSDNSVEIKYEKTDPGTYTVILEFHRLANARQPLTVFSIDGYEGTLTTIEPIDPRRGIGYSYKYRIRRGLLNPTVDDNFAYILPYEPSTNVMIREINLASSKLLGSDTDTPGAWKAYRYYTDDQRTVHATRKGIVVSLRSENDIYIEHRDGTFAKYSGFKPGSIAVKLGQTVYPGDVLGENSKTNNNSHGISIIYYYLSIDSKEAAKNFSDTKTRQSFYAPKFLTESGVDYLQKNQRYTAKLTKEILQKEMSKREIRNRRK